MLPWVAKETSFQQFDTSPLSLLYGVIGRNPTEVAVSKLIITSLTFARFQKFKQQTPQEILGYPAVL